MVERLITPNATSPCAPGLRLVAVELTDHERGCFGAWLQQVGRGLISCGCVNESALIAIARFDMLFRTPRSQRLLHQTLLDGAGGHRLRTTTVKLRRVQAETFCRWLIDDVENCVQLEAAVWRIRVAVRLATAACNHRGKRPRVGASEVACMVKGLQARGRGRLAAVDDVAARLELEPCSVYRALKRSRSRRGLAASLLSE